MADLDDIKDGKDFRTDQPQKNIPFTRFRIKYPR